MPEPNVIDLAFAIERAVWALQAALAARGYPRVRLDRPREGLLRLTTESDGGIRVEAWFPTRVPIDQVVAWASALPFPPERIIEPDSAIEVGEGGVWEA